MQLDTHGNWCYPATWRLSPNHNHRPDGEIISLIVVHGISLPAGEFGTGCPADLFLNQLDTVRFPELAEVAELRVSAHALIERDGSVTQFVPFGLRAWHAGASSFGGREGCNDFSIGVELEGTDHTPYTTAQYERLGRLIRSLRVHYPAIDADAVVGHEHIAPGRKTDPGPAFDWNRLKALI